jgi:hypothetical protein
MVFLSSDKVVDGETAEDETVAGLLKAVVAVTTEGEVALAELTAVSVLLAAGGDVEVLEVDILH